MPKTSPAGLGYAKATSIRPSYETAGGGLTRMSRERLGWNQSHTCCIVRTMEQGLFEEGQGTRPSGMAARSTTKTAHHKHGRALALCIDTSLRYFNWWTWDIRVPTG